MELYADSAACRHGGGMHYAVALYAGTIACLHGTSCGGVVACIACRYYSEKGVSLLEIQFVGDERSNLLAG